MAKGGKQKGNKNVFKVAGARSLKAKNKAKAVSTQLKKNIEQLDKLVRECQDTLRQLPTKIQPSTNCSSESKPKQEMIEKFSKVEEISAQAIDKLSTMEV